MLCVLFSTAPFFCSQIMAIVLTLDAEKVAKCGTDARCGYIYDGKFEDYRVDSHKPMVFDLYRRAQTFALFNGF